MKKLSAVFLSILLCVLCVTPVFASSATPSIPEERLLERLVDDADLLSDDEEYELLSLLNEISEANECDVAIVTLNSLEGKTATEAADDFYDYNGFGYGAGDDGILFLISMEARDWAISTYGSAINSFNDSTQESMMSLVLPLLGDGDYIGAFNKFADSCNSVLNQGSSGSESVDIFVPGASSISTEDFFSGILICFAIALIAGLITVFIMKGGMKSVRPQALATAYQREGSMSIIRSSDNFLYATVTRVKIERNSNNGGSSTHSSSSGRSHGGSSGKF